MPITEAQFDAAAAVIADKSVKPIAPFTFADQCRFYGLYKRGKVGRLLPPFEADDADTDKRPASRPGILSVTARAKYDAWAAAQDMSKQEARDEYVALGRKLVGAPLIDEAIQKAS
jgi:acyl-CoA-binding protein